MAEPAQAWSTVADALITRGTVRAWQGRLEEGNALLVRGLELALRDDLPHMAIRAHNNLGAVAWGRDRTRDALDHCEQALVLTRARGDRVWERELLGSKVNSLAALGRWNEALALADTLGIERADEEAIFYLSDSLVGIARIQTARADHAALEKTMELIALGLASSDTQIYNSCATAKAIAEQALDHPEQALELGLPVVGGEDPGCRRYAYAEACLAAWKLDLTEELHNLIRYVDDLPAGDVIPSMRAQADRFVARLAVRQGDEATATDRLERAADAFRRLDYPFELAQTLLEHSETLLEKGRAGGTEGLLAEAGVAFAELRAEPWRGRVAKAREGR